MNALLRRRDSTRALKEREAEQDGHESQEASVVEAPGAAEPEESAGSSWSVGLMIRRWWWDGNARGLRAFGPVAVYSRPRAPLRRRRLAEWPRIEEGLRRVERRPRQKSRAAESAEPTIVEPGLPDDRSHLRRGHGERHDPHSFRAGDLR